MQKGITADSAEPTRTEPRNTVGVALGTGGLASLEQLLDGLAGSDGLAAIVVAHAPVLSAQAMTGLRARASGLAVVFPEAPVAIVSGRVYVGSSARRWTVTGGVLHPDGGGAYGPDGVEHPIDTFFRSLAADQRERAVGVVLAGEGRDGASGLQAIKAAGGLALVEQPAAEHFAGMPRSALAAGSVDVCDAPPALAAAIMRLSAEPPALLDATTAEAQRARLATLVRSRFGVELANYRPATVERRLGRRMMLRHAADLGAYLELLESDPAELTALRRDMLLTVTSFFRDAEPFDLLRNQTLPRLLQQRPAEPALRIWAPACASGQEAYSLAICALEALEARGDPRRLQVFGTDAEVGSIATARRGIYPATITSEVSADRLQRFFQPRGDGSWQVSAQLRDTVTFSHHDVLADAPFSRLDLVSCRNLLIYLLPAAQRRVLRSLHFALVTDGALLLGTSETVGDAEGLFKLVDQRNKLYIRKTTAALPPFVSPRAAPPQEGAREPAPARPARPLALAADRLLIEEYAPASVVVDEQLEVMLFRGQTGPFIEPVSGAASLQLLRMTPLELHAELRRVTQAALQQRVRTTGEATLSREGARRTVRISAQPIGEAGAGGRFALVVFEQLDSTPDGALAATSGRDASLAERVRELERALTGTHRHLQEVLDDHRTTTEDLRAANEELQSSNEELHSSNEELEVSRAELQSMNEDMASTNEVLRVRMAELGRLNDDLHNVLVVVEHAVLILGPRLELLRFNDTAARLLRLGFADVGRRLMRLDGLLGRPAADALADVIATGTVVNTEVLLPDGRWHALRVRQYRSLEGAAKGAVITLTDVHAVRLARELQRDVREYALHFLAKIRQPLLILDAQLKVQWANPPWYDHFHVTAEEVVGAPLSSVSERWSHAPVLAQLGALAGGGEALDALELAPGADGAPALALAAQRIPVGPDTSLLLVSAELAGAPDE